MEQLELKTSIEVLGSEETTSVCRSIVVALGESPRPLSGADFLSLVDEVAVGNEELSELLPLSYSTAGNVLKNPEVVAAIFDELEQNGLLSSSGDEYSLTPSGITLKKGIIV